MLNKTNCGQNFYVPEKYVNISFGFFMFKPPVDLNYEFVIFLKVYIKQ